jgi:uncharacterized protein DUF4838
MRIESGTAVWIRTEDDSPEVAFAAAELGRYLDASLGVTVHRDEAPEGEPRFVLICQAPGPTPLLDPQADRFSVNFKRHSVRIKGRSPRAVLFGVYEFLSRHLGCRWVAPGEDVVPRHASLFLPEDGRIVRTPEFGYRSIVLYPFYPERSVAEIDWAAKMGLNTVHPGVNGSDHWTAFDARATVVPEIRKRGLDLHYGGHTFYGWIPPREYFESHPEYYAVVDGQRSDALNVSSLCLSNPDVVDVAVRHMLAFIEANPETRIIDLWTMDGHAYCACSACQARLGPERESLFGMGRRKTRTTTEPVLAFVNAVAERIAGEHPGVWVNYLAYMNMIEAPQGVTPAENVLVGFAPIDRLLGPYDDARERDYLSPLSDADNANCRRHLDEMKRWLDVTDRFYVYDYFSHIKTTLGMIGPDTPARDVPAKLVAPERASFFPAWPTVCEDLALYRELGIPGVSTETWDWDAINMYAFAHMAWDTSEEAWAILAEYCRAAYPGAVDPMIEHWTHLQDAGWDLAAAREACAQQLDQALEAAQSEAVQHRLQDLQRRWVQVT